MALATANTSDATEVCVHHWMIESPRGDTSHGVCKLCGDVGEFQNSVPEYKVKGGRGIGKSPSERAKEAWEKRRENGPESKSAKVRELALLMFKADGEITTTHLFAQSLKEGIYDNYLRATAGVYYTLGLSPFERVKRGVYRVVEEEEES
jgi:hypothetical protein